MSLSAPNLPTRRAPEPDPGAGAGSGGRRAGFLEHLALALVAYVPQLWAQPGTSDSDIKSYLYLDPGRFIGQSASMWDPTVGLGTVTHEQMGYLWPLGPYYWLIHALGIPLWVGERLWTGTLLFAAGAGVLFLCRTLGLSRPGRTVAAFAFMLSPYFLQDVGRISSLLLPWSGLGWLLGCVIRGVRSGGWRWPAVFALVWLTISGNNASGPIYAAVAPALWLLYVVFVSKEHSLRQAWAATWRTALLTAGVSLWWAWSLVIEGHYGVNILGYTETVAAVAKTSTAAEILRGLGYWFFYGADVGGVWAAPLTGFTQELLLVALTFTVPVLALAGAAVVRWRHRAYFLFLVVVALVLAVGSHPYAGPSVVGSLIKAFMLHTTAGLALRSSDRATPMVLLGLVVLLGAALTALAARRRLLGLGASALVLVVVAVANPAVWNGSTVLDRYRFPTPPPTYVTKAAAALNATGHGTRVLAIPSENTAAYTYGDTVDPIWPGLLDRPFVTGEQVPLGSLASYDLLYGLDTPMQSGTADPAALAPMARLMDAGDVLVQNDLAYWLYQRPTPQEAQSALDLPQPGLGTAESFGTPRPSIGKPPVIDEAVLAGSPSAPWPAPLEVLPVSDPRPVVRAESTGGALVVAGDGPGLDAAAGLGLLDTDAPILYAGTLDTHRAARAAALAGDSTLVVTDTNRKEDYFWNSVSDNAEATLSAKAQKPTDTLNVFPSAPADAQSTADDVGIASVSATPNGDDHQAVLALDGDVDTSWQTNIGSPASGKWWQVVLSAPVTTDHITVVQAQPGDYQHDRWITQANISLDGGAPIAFTLGPASHQAPGQTISFSRQSFTTMRFTIVSTNLSNTSTAAKNDASPVGLAEVGIPGVHVEQVVAMPTDLLKAAGTASQSHRLVLIMTRLRDTPNPPQADPEPVLDRLFTLPTTRSFSLVGSASISGEAADGVVDGVVGRGGRVTATSSNRLPGDPAATASAALDGDPSTMWVSGMGKPNVAGSWIQVDTPHTLSVDHLDLQVAADTYHSVPTRLLVQACNTPGSDGRCPTGSDQATVALPPVRAGARGHEVSLPVDFPAVHGRDVTVTFSGVKLRNTKGSSPLAKPLGVAELGIPGVRVPPPPAQLPGTCRSDLMALDGTPVSVAVTGSTADALAGRELSVHLCGPDAAGLTLDAGRHMVSTTSGAASGLIIDQLALDSAPGGRAMALGTGATPLVPPADAPPAPRVRVVSSGPTQLQLRVTGATTGRSFWLVLGQSLNTGWQASAGGRALGTSMLVDGFANGWLVTPSSGSFSVALRWTPQGGQDLALVVSALSALVCLVLVLAPVRRRRAGRATATPAPAAAAFPDGPVLAQGLADAPSTPPWVALPVGVICGLVAAVLVPPGAFPFVFLGVAAAVVLALVLPSVRALLGLAGVALAVGAVVYVVLSQAHNHFGANGSWPQAFESADPVVWAAVLLLAADAVVELVRRRR